MAGCCAIFSIHRKSRNRIETNERPRQAQPFRARESNGTARILEIPRSPRVFTFEELSSATGGFKESNKLGEGGFGIVYRGKLSRTNETVAIKKLKRDARLGEQQFLTEVQTISRAYHKHIVSLVGYYIGQDEAHEETMMLVYEYIPNNSLSHLHGEGRETIDWKTRMKIAVGSAKGLRYLHEDCKTKIIHRDIKPDNILLLEDFQPMITDFGLAKLLPDNASHISAQELMGTLGYFAPEYLAGGKISEKMDVFSFGVVLLELITGKTPRQSFTDGMVSWATPILRNALKSPVNFEELADPSLQKDYNVDEMRRMVSCAAHCFLPSAKCRPQMSTVVDALEGKIDLKNNNCGELSPPMDSGLESMFQAMAQKKVDGTSSYQNA